MSWKVSVDAATCIGSGICAGMAPERFVLNGRWATVIQEDTEPDEVLLDAADSCPAGAITVVEDGEEIGPRP
jgi:ferredoxin